MRSETMGKFRATLTIDMHAENQERALEEFWEAADEDRTNLFVDIQKIGE